MKMSYSEYSYQDDPISKIKTILNSINQNCINITKNKKNKKNNKHNNKQNNNNSNINKIVLNEYCNDKNKFNYNSNSWEDGNNKNSNNNTNIDVIRESPNSQCYLNSSLNMEDRVEYWFKGPEDWEINLKILCQLKWRKQMTVCFKRYKTKTRKPLYNVFIN